MSGVSTRRVDDLVRALGIEGISRSEVSRACAALDAEVAAFRSRSLAEVACPYLWLDATYLKVREGGRVVSMAALVATGVALSGERRVLGLELSAGNDEGSAWPTLRALARRAGPPRRAPRHLRRPRGPGQGRSTSSSWAPPGSAAGSTSRATPRTSCPRSARSMVASAVRIGHRAARRDGAPGSSSTGWSTACGRGSRPSPTCSRGPRPGCSPTSPSPSPTAARSAAPTRSERLDKEIKRRTAVVGIFPTRASVLRLVGMILAEQDDEWQDGRRYFQPETLALYRRRARVRGGGASPAHGKLSDQARGCVAPAVTPRVGT